MFNALASRMTPAAAGSPAPAEEIMHGNVTSEDPGEDAKSDRSSDDVSLRFTGEFNSVERPPPSQRITARQVLIADKTPTDSRLAFQRNEITDHQFGVSYFSSPHRDPTVDELSERLGRHEVQNVTARDTKRQRERPKDLEYKRRFSLSALPVAFSPTNGRSSTEQEFPGGAVWPRRSPEASTQHVVTSDLGQHGYAGSGCLAFSPVPSIPPPSSGYVRYTIRLTHAGQTVVHYVWEQMPIAQLAEEAVHGIAPDFESKINFRLGP